MDFRLEQHETLLTVSTAWNFEKDNDPYQLEYNMCDFMVKNHGIGLAANQIGLTKRVFCMGSDTISGFAKPFALFNPKIVEISKEQVLDTEGCLSYPGLFLKIKRPDWVLVEYQNAAGEYNLIKVDGYMSKCVQHEIDHLDGVCFVDKVSQMKLKLALNKIRKKNGRTQ